MSTDVQNSCTDRFIDSKFAIKLLLNSSPHFKGVVTLPCEILKSGNSNNVKHVLWLTINNKVAWGSCIFKVWRAIQLSCHCIYH